MAFTRRLTAIKTIERAGNIHDLVLNTNNAATFDDGSGERTPWQYFRESFEVVVAIATILDTAEDETANFRRSVDEIRDQIHFSLKQVDRLEAAGQQTERAGEAVRNIPVSQLRAGGRVADRLGDTVEEYTREIEQLLKRLDLPINQFKLKLDLLFEKTETARSLINKLDAGLLGLDVFVALATEQDKWAGIRDVLFDDYANLGETLGAGAALAATTSPAALAMAEAQPLEVELSLPEAIAGSAEAGLAAFDARFDSRAAPLQQILGKLGAFFDLVQSVIPEGVGIEQLEEISQQLIDGLNAAMGAARAFTQPIRDASPVISLLSSVGNVFKVLVDAIQPLLDFFGPVLGVINSVIEKIEDALGLAAIEDFLLNTVKAPIDALMDELRAIIEEQFAPLEKFFGQFDNVLAAFDVIGELMNDLYAFIFSPVADVGEGLLDGFSILAGAQSDDTIRLALDDRHDDGYGGLGSGGEGNDVIVGTERPDVINGGAGDDLLIGLGGEKDDPSLTYTGDVIFGQAGNDEIDGGAGRDALMGGTGDDMISGGAGGDFIAAGPGDDTVFGDAGDDVIEGEAGEDTLEGGAGDDILNGGDDADVLRDGEGVNILDGEGGLDLIDTTGSADAVHTILDPDAVLRGGAGTDIVRIGREFATGPVAAAVDYDGGANFDRFVAAGLDLRLYAAAIRGFESLEIGATSGGTVLFTASGSLLAGFEQVTLFGDQPILMTAAGPLDMNGPVPFDLSAFAQGANPQDGAAAPDVPFESRGLSALTVQTQAGVAFSGLAGSTAGITILGAGGAETLTGGGGSDVIRAGLGADVVSGGPGDTGNRFDIDAAVGDVFLGTPGELDGDIVLDLTNRVDRVRILGSRDYVLAASETAEGKLVSIHAPGADPATSAPIARFELRGEVSKLFFRGGTGPDGDYTEILNNNVPPTAADDDIEAAYGAPVPIDPFANDFDADTGAGVELPADGVLDRRSIAVTASQNLLFREVTEGEIRAGRFDGDTTSEPLGRAEFIAALGPVPLGTEFATALGNRVVLTADGPVYLAGEPVIGLRRFTAADGIAAGNYDVTEDLPFFGLDSFEYQVVDHEGEISRIALFEILIRPQVIGGDGAPRSPQVTVEGEGGTIQAGLTEWQPGAAFGRRSLYTSSANQDLATATGGNDHAVITALGSYFSFEGNDVLDARGATGPVALAGGNNADWIEGGDFTDFLTGGGLDDEVIQPSLRTDVADPGAAEGYDATVPPNILIGGGGDNVYGASVDHPTAGIDTGATRSRETIYVLDGGAETIFGGPLLGVGATGPAALSLNPLPGFGASALAAQALDADEVRGFDNDDRIVVPMDLVPAQGSTSTVATQTRSYDIGILGNLNILTRVSLAHAETTGLIVTDADLSGRVGGSNGFLSGLFDDTTFNTNSVTTASGRADFNFPTFSNLLNLSGTVSPGYNAIPQIVAYDLDVDMIDPTGGALAKTVLNVSLESYRFDTSLFAAGAPSYTHGVVLGGILPVGFFVDASIAVGLTARLVRDNGFLDPANAFAGNGISFSMELDGQYRDRFVLDIVPLSETGAIPFIETGTPYARLTTSGGDHYAYASRSTVDGASAQAPLGLAIRYVSEAPEAAADAVAVRRSESVTFDVTANDTDGDGDPIGIFDLVFGSEADEARLLDGDTTNGELILATDPGSGFGTGVITYIAPAFVPGADAGYGEERFSYIAEDGEFTADPVDVVIDITGLPPVARGETLRLPWDTDGFVPIGALLANDFDPDAPFDPIDPSTFGLDPDQSEGLTPVFDGDGNLIGLQIGPAALDALRARAAIAPALSETDAAVDFRATYELADAAGSGRSATVRTVWEMAPELALDLAPRQVAEDGSVAIDVLAGVTGGFGGYRLVSAGAPVVTASDGSTPAIGTVEIAGGNVVFTPLPDLWGVTATIPVTVRDSFGSTVSAGIEVLVGPGPADDAPGVTILTPAGGAIRTSEDAPVTATLLLFDPDLVTLGPVPDPGAIALLQALADDPASLPSLDLAAGAAAPLIDATAVIETARGGTVTLSPTASPFVLSMTYVPGANAFGADSVALLLGDPTDPAADFLPVRVDLTIDPVNDAPFYLAAAPAVRLDVGQTLTIDLLDAAADIDGTIDVSTLTALTDAAGAGIIALSVEDGIATVTGLASGQAGIEIALADDQGAPAPARTIEVSVNAGPAALDDRIQIIAPFAPVTIDPLANDADPDGTFDFVRDEDGVPVLTGPQGQQVGGGALAILGTVTYDAATDRLVYTPPSDPSLAGATDIFSYRIEDDDGATAQATVLIDLVAPPADGAAILSFGSAAGDVLAATPFVDAFLLGGGHDTVLGVLADLAGDRIHDFSADAALVVSDVAPSDLVLGWSRDRGTPPAAPPAFAALAASALPTVEQIFGGVTVESLLDAFVGDTILTLESGGIASSLTLTGAFLGGFSVAAANGGSSITYTPQGSGNAGTGGDDELTGGPGDDLLQGLGGDDILRGREGDDTLEGGTGSDVLFGGPGDDVLTGGEGPDLFVLSSTEAPDTITDFNPLEGDRIAITAGAYLNEDLTVDLSRLTIVAGPQGTFSIVGDPNQPGDEGPAEPIETLAHVTLATVAPPEPPTVGITAIAVPDAEGDGAPRLVTVTLSRTGAASDPQGSLGLTSRVDIAVTGSGAAPADAADFDGGVLPAGTVTFAEGQEVASFTFAIAADSAIEPDETFAVAISSPVGAVIGAATIGGTIVNDDANAAPVAVDDVATATEDAGIAGNVIAGSDTDPDGDALTVSAVGGDASAVGSAVTLPGGGLLTLDADGSFGFDPNGAYDGLGAASPPRIETVTYTVTDGLETATAEIRIEVAGVNDAPVAADDGFETDEDSAVTLGGVLANDDDVDGDALTVQSLDLTGTLGIVTLNGDGTFDYDPNGAFEVLDDGETAFDGFAYIVSDGNGGSATARVTIAVAGVTDAPALNPVTGTGDSDLLQGTGAADAIRGLGGSYDRLAGGGGPDQFIFGDEARNGARERDMILDYEAGLDEIVLRDGAAVETIRESSSAIVIFLQGDLDAIYVLGDGLSIDDVAIVTHNDPDIA